MTFFEALILLLLLLLLLLPTSQASELSQPATNGKGRWRENEKEKRKKGERERKRGRQREIYNKIRQMGYTDHICSPILFKFYFYGEIGTSKFWSKFDDHDLIFNVTVKKIFKKLCQKARPISRFSLNFTCSNRYSQEGVYFSWHWLLY